MRYIDMLPKDVKVTSKTDTFMMDFEFHDQEKDPAPQSMDLLLIDRHGHFAIGYNSEDRGFYHTYDGLNHEFREVVYWAYLQRIPSPLQRGIITNDEWITAVARAGELKK